MKKNYLKQKNKGFALLFSVLMSSFLLTIGLSIFSIALKELSISTAARQSIHAFFAADSGREYLLYRDIKEADIFSPEEIQVLINNGPALNYEEPISFVAVEGPNYEVAIEKTWDSANNKINTTIISRGYDSENDDKVERAIEQTY